jgi:hypothetical protein
MAVLTLHHWSDLRAGCAELRRVARDRVVVFSWDPTYAGLSGSARVLPEPAARGRRRLPVAGRAGGRARDADVEVVPVPWDCRDGFFSAFWRRPEAYLDPAVRAGISTLAKRSERARRGARAPARRPRQRRLGAPPRRPARARRARPRLPPARRPAPVGTRRRVLGSAACRSRSPSSSSRARKPAERAASRPRRRAARQAAAQAAPARSKPAPRSAAARQAAPPSAPRQGRRVGRGGRAREPQRAARHAAQGRRPHRRRRQGHARRRRQARAHHAQGRHRALPEPALRGPLAGRRLPLGPRAAARPRARPRRALQRPRAAGGRPRAPARRRRPVVPDHASTTSSTRRRS